MGNPAACDERGLFWREFVRTASHDEAKKATCFVCMLLGLSARGCRLQQHIRVVMARLSLFWLALTDHVPGIQRAEAALQPRRHAARVWVADRGLLGG